MVHKAAVEFLRWRQPEWAKAGERATEVTEKHQSPTPHCDFFIRLGPDIKEKVAKKMAPAFLCHRGAQCCGLAGGGSESINL